MPTIFSLENKHKYSYCNHQWRTINIYFHREKMDWLVYTRGYEQDVNEFFWRTTKWILVEETCFTQLIRMVDWVHPFIIFSFHKALSAPKSFNLAFKHPASMVLSFNLNILFFKIKHISNQISISFSKLKTTIIHVNLISFLKELAQTQNITFQFWHIINLGNKYVTIILWGNYTFCLNSYFEESPKETLSFTFSSSFPNISL